MAITTGDIRILTANNRVEDDLSVCGGTINNNVKATFNQMSGLIRVTSTGAGDNQLVTARGRDNSGVIVSEGITLNGLSQVSGSQNFQRILTLQVPLAHTGTITVSRQSDQSVIATLESGITGVACLFINSKANPTSGPTRNYYEKVYLKNLNTGSAALNLVLSEFADSTAYVTFGIESGIVNSANTITGRLDTAPTGVSAYTSSSINLPSGNLLPTGAVPIWLRLTLPSGVSPATGFYSIQASFDSA